MSMPTFPEIDPEITCERALNMILTSIAMEEAALSHLVNAEGEKLQYVLGTLESSSGAAPDIDEVIRVNQSVTGLMDSISQYQMLLKSKMDKALHALAEICPRSPSPPCPPVPPKPPAPPCPPDPPCPPGPCGPAGPPEGRCAPCSCGCKCSAAFTMAEACKLWRQGCALPWHAKKIQGRCVCCKPCDRAQIGLRARGRFLVDFTAHVRATGCACDAIIRLYLIKNRQFTDIHTIHSHIPGGNNLATLSVGGIMIENCCHAASLIFMLESADALIVEDAVLRIMEL